MSKVLVITGGASGIGAATARLAVEKGYSIAINYRTRELEAARLVDELKSSGARAIAVQADISRPEDIERLYREVDEKLGTMPVPPAWKTVVGSKVKNEILGDYFNQLKSSTSLGAELARAYALQSNAIGLKLVKSKVALNENDVNTVLLTGFFHAYGPINNYLA